MSHLLLVAVQYGCLALQVWALIDCVTRNNKAFPLAGKLTKPAWLAITAIAAIITLFTGVLGILGIAGLIASIVYLVDVRPAVREVSGGNKW